MDSSKKIPLSEEFEWMGVKIKKSSLKPFIVEIPRYNKKLNVEYRIEYLTVEGKIRILDEVCAIKNWHKAIRFEYEFIGENKKEIIVSCEIIIKENESIVAQSKAFSYGSFSSSEEFAKLQTAAFNHAARILGIGVESLEEENEEVQQDIEEATSQPTNNSALDAEDLAAIEKIESYASKHPEYGDKVRVILRGMGKEDLRQLNKQEFETFKNVIRKFREEPQGR